MTTGHSSAERYLVSRQSALRNQRALLLSVDEVGAAVLLPACLGALGASRFFLAVADGLDTVGGNSCANEGGLCRACAVIAECKVVLGGTTFVAMTFDCDFHVRVLLQECSIALNGRLAIRANIVLVIVKEDVLHVLREQLFFARRRLWSRWRWRRSRHGHAGRCVRRAAGSLGRHMVGRRVTRR